MRDDDKAKKQLIKELEDMSQRFAEIGKPEAEHKKEVEKEMGNKEAAKETTEGADGSSADTIAALAQEAGKVILEASRAAKQEAEQEAERVLRQYEQKTRQIVLKIREETKVKATVIANRIRDAIMLKIEQASADVIAKSSERVEELVGKTQQIASEEVGQAPAEVKKAEAKGDSVAQEETAGTKERKAGPATEEGGIELQQPSEKIEQWITLQE